MDFDQAVAELETLVGTLEREGDERGLLLLELVDAIHRPALERILKGQCDDPIAEAVLAMYDLAPVDDRLRVEEALDQVRPYIESHGGEVTLLKVDDGVIHLQMSGACQGCAGSAMTLKRGIEERLREHYPGFREVVAHEPEQLLQIEGLRRPVFEPAGSLRDLAPGEMLAVELDRESVLVLNVGGEPFAFRNACPTELNRELRLDGGRLAGYILICPWHNCAYDARTGKRVDDQPDAPGLAPVPVALESDLIRVAVNVA